ncbi:potassium transporter TrkG [Paenibacillus lactis]|uniref:potassium transporter TrkG n=1 Tax=Paenibacillus lactis TaxID=228574 RepID=UPI0002D82F0A|nr:potassium transporter TrkG [Paenibacillus lactis]MCM3496574.1 hypothetical protein [Paenibacillus lactis]GIO94243.1 hypothetical protein J31TS3_54700 [Paenibacillus lactis]
MLISFAFETLGTILLAIRWHEIGWVQALYYGLFHSVSAFNNAGSFWSDSLSSFVGDPVVNITIVLLFVIADSDISSL